MADLIVIERAKEILDTIRSDPKRTFRRWNKDLRDILSDFNLSFSDIGSSSEEYTRLEREYAIATAKEYFACAEARSPKWGWLSMVELTMERHRLTWEEVGIRRTRFLQMKHWFMRKELSHMEVA